MRVFRFLRSRFLRTQTRRDWRILVGTGIYCIVFGLFGFWVGSDEALHPFWQNVVLPTLMLVMGGINLFVAWRRRHWSFDR